MRPATLNDIDNIVNAFAHDMRNGHFHETDLESLRKAIRSYIAEGKSGPAGREVPTFVYVYDAEGAFAACAVVRDLYRPKVDPVYPENTKELWMLSVIQGKRGKGYGTEFTRELIRQYSDYHLVACCKQASKRMAGILQTLRFVVIGKLRGSPGDTLLFFDISRVAVDLKKRLLELGSIV